MKPLRYIVTGVLAITGLYALAVHKAPEAVVPPQSTIQIVLKLPAPAIQAATASLPAVRDLVFTQVTPTLPEPDTTGLLGMPYAPNGLDNCGEMNFYRVQAGLPVRFDALGWRESNCRNEEGVKTFCCYGYWQIYYTLHADKLAAYCNVQSKYDINGNEPLDKQKQACSAKVLYDESGYQPWGK